MFHQDPKVRTEEPACSTSRTANGGRDGGGVLTRRPPASSQSLGVLYGEPLKRRLSHSQPGLQRRTSLLVSLRVWQAAT